MKIKSTSLLAAAFCLLTAVSPSLAATKMGTVTGVMTDDMCKGQHATMMPKASAAECVKACVKGGSKLVFMDQKNKKVYHLTGGSRLDSLAGKRVSVSGHIDDSSNMIHVHAIKAL